MGWKERKQELGRELLKRFYENGLLRTWLRDQPDGWELVSGIWSPFYIQARLVPSHPGLMEFIGKAMAELLREEAPDVNRVVGLAAAGVPIAVAAGMSAGLPVCYTRKLPGVRSLEDLARVSRNYGEHSLVEGIFAPGDRIALVDDVVARFTSKVVGARQVEMELAHRGLTDARVVAVAVLIDREQGTREAAEALGLRLLSLLRLRSEGLGFLREVADPREAEVISAYLENDTAFQSPEVREDLAREARARRG